MPTHGKAKSPGPRNPRLMELIVKASALGILLALISSASAFAHSGHATEGSVLHAAQHASGGWLAAAVLVVLGASAAVLTRAA